MNTVFTAADLQGLRKIGVDSHKGQNGRLLLIGGSHLFHAASLWSLTVASRIVDLVHFASVPENNAIVHECKKEFRNGIVIERKDIEEYIQEDDVILIGPGMNRTQKTQITNYKLQITNLSELDEIGDEGEQTQQLTHYLLQKYPEKQWVIDAGSLQMLSLADIPPHAILTPHHKEFEGLMEKSEITSALVGNDIQNEQGVGEVAHSNSRVLQSFVSTQAPSVKNSNLTVLPVTMIDQVQAFAKKYQCIVLLKGQVDIVSDGEKIVEITGGNAGMTKGGTGDVLAGLISALATTNDPFLATCAGSFINKSAGDALYTTVGPYFNATDLANEIPKVMGKIIRNA